MSREGGARRWADEDDDEDHRETKRDTNVVRERVSFSVNAKGQKVKTTTKYKVREISMKVPKRVQARKNLPRFGDARVGEEGVTLQSKDIIFMEHPDDQMAEDVDDPSLAKTLASFIMKQQETKLARDSDIDTLQFDGNGDIVSSSEPDIGASTKSDKYVPPGSRAGAVSGGGATLEDTFKDKQKEREAENTIRVSNLTKSATEDDLRELFEPFGRVFRISLPRAERVENGKVIKEPRGFAYIAYVRKEDAERAMDRLQGYGYDHLLLKLEWAKATTKDSGGGGPPGDNSMRFASGYGKALAQDTKEKVVYASNLTGNTGSWLS